MIKNVLIALDSFKGSISSKDANIALANGILSINSQLNIECVPIGDGGEGTLEAIATALSGEIRTIKVINSQFVNKDSKYYINDKEVVIESSEIIGLTKLDKDPDAYNDSSAGLGILIRTLLEEEVKKITVTLGGSATNDFGLGMLHELGAKFFDLSNTEIVPLGVNSLQNIESVDLNSLDSRLKTVEFEILSDVSNPLIGENGATYTYGKQKGIHPSDFQQIDDQVKRVSAIIEQNTNRKIQNQPMAGAAGGLGFIFMTVFNAKAFNGIETILERIKIEDKVKNSDLVITGEGSMDHQTYYGKAPIGISNLARKHNKLCFAVTGNNSLVDDNYQKHFGYIFNLTNGPISLDEAIKNAEKLMTSQGKQIGRIVELLDGDECL